MNVVTTSPIHVGAKCIMGQIYQTVGGWTDSDIKCSSTRRSHSGEFFSEATLLIVIF